MILTNASPKAIRYACQEFHYSQSVPSVQYGYNIYTENGEWCGVICFGGGANPRIGSPYGLCQGEVLELVRVALNGKQSYTSQCVAAALRELRKQNPLVRLVVSFADMNQNHYGTIYQATNWIYEGITQERERCAFIILGKKMHPKSVHAKGWRQSLPWIQEHIDPDAEIVYSKGKHKYLFCFDRKLAKKYRETAKTYLKKPT